MVHSRGSATGRQSSGNLCATIIYFMTVMECVLSETVFHKTSLACPSTPNIFLNSCFQESWAVSRTQHGCGTHGSRAGDSLRHCTRCSCFALDCWLGTLSSKTKESGICRREFKNLSLLMPASYLKAVHSIGTVTARVNSSSTV